VTFINRFYESKLLDDVLFYNYMYMNHQSYKDKMVV